MRKFVKILMWLGITFYMVIVLGMIEKRVDQTPCQKVFVEINDSAENHFVSEQEIYSKILTHDKDLFGKPLNAIRTDEVEKFVANDPFVKNVQAYKTMNGQLNIRVDQREPIARVLNYKGQGYYIDKLGFIMPVSPYFTARVLIINGWNLTGIKPGVNLTEVQSGKVKNTLKEIYQLALFINNDPFWKAQIEQIYVSKDSEFTFIPRVGSHTIIFGELSNYERKFKKLYALYEQGLSREGWNKYSTINLKFNNQVVCTKK